MIPDVSNDAQRHVDRATSPGLGGNVIESIDLPIILVDRDLTLANFNGAAASLLSLTSSEVGQPLRGIRMFAPITDLEERCRSAIAGASSQREVKDGAGSWFLLRIAPSTGTDQVTGAVLTLTNVTAVRASLEQAISEREYTKAIINTLIDPVVVLDEGHRVQTANHAFYEMFQVSREQAHGVRLYELGTWNIPELQSFLKASQTQDQSDALEFVHELPTTRRRTVLLNARRLARGGKLGQLILLAIQDITERKQRQEALRLAEQDLRDFVENATVGMHWAGPNGIILWANRTELDMLGYTQAEYIGRHIAEFHADQSVIEDILERLRRGETVQEYAARLRHKNGSIREVLINSNVLWEDGKFIHTRCFTRDVTESKRAEAEREKLLTQLQAERDRLNQLQAQLHDKVRDLEKFHDVVIGRELKLIELEKEIELLRKGQVLR